ncbi:MAG: DUF6448 family protein [Ignavibacteriaceae bacterium]
MKKYFNFVFISSFLTFIFIFSSQQVSAHCDGLDGPVVKAAKKALETENVNLVLIWVKKEFEDEINNAFQKTLTVRKLSPEAKEMADMYFFETIVRLHRLGEGAPYTGLKPAGRDLGPAIPLADKSIEENSAKELLELLTDEIQNGLHQYFQNVISKKDYNTNDINAGREYIEAYVVFVHYVERIYESTQILTEGQVIEAEEKDIHKH